MKLAATKASLFVAYLATVVAANWLISTFGFVPVGLGLLAPAGVYAAGFSFAFRDGLQEEGGRKLVLAAVVLGAALSFAISDGRVAVASGLAFLISELVDFAVYTPLRDRSKIAAFVASNVVGALVDSAVFLALAFGSLDFVIGNTLGKWWVTAISLPVLVVVRLVRARAHQDRGVAAA